MHCCLNGTLIVHGGMVSRKVRANPEQLATDKGDFSTSTLNYSFYKVICKLLHKAVENINYFNCFFSDKYNVGPFF